MNTTPINSRFSLSVLPLFVAALFGSLAWVAQAEDPVPQPPKNDGPDKGAAVLVEKPAPNAAVKLEKATFGGGCFWCTEGVFEQLHAVKAVVSGYAGGKTKNPTYKDITRGDTGHAEVIEIMYDPAKISYQKLLDVFWKSHDPTTLNRQGYDVGTQYRSVIFYHSDEQKKLAEASKKAMDLSGVFKNPIVTEISPAPTFYEAEAYHQDYASKNPRNRYLYNTLRPKLKKLTEDIQELNDESTKE